MTLINTAVGLLAISSPIGVLPVVARAAGGDPCQVRQISRLAVLTFLFTLLAACWWGQALLDLFAITLDTFRVAGGLILLPIGLPLLAGPAAIYLILRVSMPLRRALGELQEKVISRLMGLLLSAIGVQMLVVGVKGCFPVLAAAG